MKDYMTLPELAEYLGVGIRTLYGWRADGYAPKEFNLGRKVLFHRDDVEAWIAMQRR